MYAACTRPPTVEHVTHVEVSVEIVFVWAPVVVGGVCAPSRCRSSFDPRSRRAQAHITSQVTSHRATLVYDRGSGHRGMWTIVRICCWVRHRMCCLSAPRSAGFSGCAGWGSCWVTPGCKAYGPVAYIWVSSLAHVRVSLESLSQCIRASRQKLTRIYPTRPFGLDCTQAYYPF